MLFLLYRGGSRLGHGCKVQDLYETKPGFGQVLFLLSRDK